jgi:hypothetical protein
MTRSLFNGNTTRPWADLIIMKIISNNDNTFK